MYVNRLSHSVRFLLVTLIVASICGAVMLTTHKPVHAAGTQPTWALPFPTGTSVYIGPYGLHDHNFSSMQDDSTGKTFTFSNYLGPGSLDFVLKTQTPGGTSTTPATSVASGTVLAVWSACQLVLVDYGNGWWGMYLHMANIKVVSGNTVNTGTIIGYPTTNKPTLKACGSVESNAEHVHFVLLNGSGTRGGYVSLLGKVLCGYQVVELNNDLTNIILQGLTQTKGQVFTVPTCSAGHFQFNPSSVNVTTPSGQNPPPQTLVMTNTGNGTLAWNITSTIPSWLTVNSTSGSISPGGTLNITLTFSLSTTPGTYSTNLVFSAPNTDNSPATVPVMATVTPVSHFQFNPSSVNVSAASGQNPSPQILVMTNTGNGTLAWSLTSTLPSWLALDSTSGSISPASSENITLTFSLSTTPGTYSTNLVFSAPNTANSPATVPVTAIVVGWGTVSSPNNGTGSNSLSGISAISASDIWAVGNGPNGPLIEHYDGTSWSIISSPSSGVLTQVAAISSTDVWAVGFYGNPDQTLIEHYDGTSWSVVPSPSPGTRLNELAAIAAASANDIWAVGYYIGSDGSDQTLVEHYDGTSWSVVSSPNPGTGINQLYGVTEISGSDVWSVGDYTASYGGVPQPLIEHYDGTSWSVVTSPTVGTGNDPYELLSVVAVSANDVWAVGSNFNSSSISPTPTLIEHWDGTSWTIVPSPTTGSGGYLQSVAATSGSDVWAVGFYSNGSVDQTLIEHYDGTSWSIVSSPNIGTGDNSLYGVAAISASDVWAVGRYRNSSNIDQTLIENYN